MRSSLCAHFLCVTAGACVLQCPPWGSSTINLICAFMGHHRTRCETVLLPFLRRALTYSAWQSVSPWQVLLQYILLFAGGDWENVHGWGGKCTSAVFINVSGSAHSTGPNRRRGSALCRLVASRHRQKHWTVHGSDAGGKPEIHRCTFCTQTNIN